jgi:hypothetical protein
MDTAPHRSTPAREAFAHTLQAAGLGRPEILPDGAIHWFRLGGALGAGREAWYRLTIRPDGYADGEFGLAGTDAIGTWNNHGPDLGG